MPKLRVKMPVPWQRRQPQTGHIQLFYESQVSGKMRTPSAAPGRVTLLIQRMIRINKQGSHHEFGYAFHTLLQAEAAYEEADDYRDDHPEGHGTGLSEHTVKNAAHFIRCEGR